MIYIIKVKDKDICKIGYSENPEKRLASLQTANYEKLELITTFNGSRDLEAHLHKKFGVYRLNGEWFTYNEEIKNLITPEINSTKKESSKSIYNKLIVHVLTCNKICTEEIKNLFNLNDKKLTKLMNKLRKDEIVYKIIGSEIIYIKAKLKRPAI